MNPNRFDTITRRVATRRTALRAGGLGLFGAAFGSRALAQEATPAVDPHDPHPSADHAGVDPEFLFIQPFEGGTWEPKPGEQGMYTLTLTGASASTIYFSDRPERIVGLVPNQQFLDGLGFEPNNPPNAGIVAQRGDGPGADGSDHEVLLIELFNPVYDAEAETLTYDAQVLADYGEPGLATLAQQQQDYELGETFGEGSLFIDGNNGRCTPYKYYCYVLETGTRVGIATSKACWNWSKVKCQPCKNSKKTCGSEYPDQCKDSNGNNICVSNSNP